MTRSEGREEGSDDRILLSTITNNLSLVASLLTAAHRRYNQFDELRSSVDKYISCYAKFPSKQGLFSSLVGQKLNDQEVRRSDGWSKATAKA